MRLVKRECQLGGAVRRHQAGIFRRGDKRGAPGGCFAHQRDGLADILRHIIAGTQLNTRSFEGGRPEYRHGSYFTRSWILTMPALVQTSSLSPPGAPEPANTPPVSEPAMIGTAP